MKLENAQRSVEMYESILKAAAKKYANNKCTFAELADAAKRHTNAVHALGRAKKAAMAKVAVRKKSKPVKTPLRIDSLEEDLWDRIK